MKHNAYKLNIIVYVLMLIISICSCASPPAGHELLKGDYVQKSNSRIYYTADVPQSDVDALVDYFDTDGYFNRCVYMKLDKTDIGEYLIYICVSNNVLQSENLLAFYEVTTNDIALTIFYPNKVTVFLCSKAFDPVKTYESSIPKPEE